MANNIITHSYIVHLAIPIILANMAAPLLGLVDTAVIGHTGNASDLGAIALGSLVFNFVYWAFGFLRMGTTGFISQAAGAGDYAEVRAAFGRALLLGGVIGLLLICAQYPLIHSALWLLDGSKNVEEQVKTYWDIRIWAAPATLASYAIMGCLIGLGKTRQLLWLQLFLNITNLALDILFVAGFDWGVRGIALGTLIAEWSSALLGLVLIFKNLRIQHEKFLKWSQLLNRSAIVKTLGTNADIMWRTLFLLGGFAFFANQGARFGDNTLAANHILLQFISFSAFFLDGFAFALESLVGKAKGACNRELFDRVIKVSTQIAASTAVLLMSIIIVGGTTAIAGLTSVNGIQEEATKFLPYAAIYVAVSFAAFQLDGIFIGATHSRAMRNASFYALLIFLTGSWILIPLLGNHGLWTAFVIYVIARAITLGIYLPELRRSIAPEST
ncbi:MAG: MATE family efflux transporter [Cellvibrio sp. 79]|nr:MAG: MATE family efflux transporter [Cellvibrio sp. 79]